MCSCWWGEWASCSWRVRGLGCALVCGFWEWCVLRGCARECDWVARALLVLRLMGVWVVVVCSACVGFVRLPERPV